MKSLYQVFIQLSVVSFMLIGCNSTKSNKNQVNKESLPTKNLQETNFFDDYTIISKEYGTETFVSVENDDRVMKTNALPNHPTGKFPTKGNPNKISAQDLEYKFPVTPKFSGKSKWAREPGVALNGVKFEPETAERFICETGEVYKIEAIQDLVNLGLDFNNAHVQPTGAYHYHGVPVELIRTLNNGNDLILVGFALDGFPIYYSISGKYKPSYQISKNVRTGDVCNYNNPKHGMKKELQDTMPDGTFVSDWEYIDGLGNLDECNGIEINGEYMYFVTEEYPFMSRCLKGVFVEKRRKGPPPGHHPHRREHGNRANADRQHMH